MFSYDFSKVDGVVFDFGGVISESPMSKWDRTFYPYCESVGLSRQAVREGFARYRALWDGDMISFAEMYARIFALDGLPPPSEDVLSEIRRLDAASWVDELRPDTLELMTTLKRQGKRLGILSNMSSDFYRDFYVPRCEVYRELVDMEVISGLEHMCKPDRRIYALAADRMGLPESRLLFVDDSEANVRAACACGWQSEIYPPQRG